MSAHPEVDRFLKDQGRSLDGKPLYRLVWSEDSFEWRRGNFREFYGSVFLREVADVRYVPKYPYIDHRWIIEKYFPESHSEELPVYDHYEPIFCFQDKDSKELPVSLKMVEILISFDRNLDRIKSRASADFDQFEKLEKQEFNKILDSIDSSPIASLLHSKEAIVRP